MPVSLFFDVQIPEQIAIQLRRRGVDVLRAQEDHSDRLTDEEVLERASLLGRVVFTFDVRFRALAEDWQRIGRPFAGLAFGRQSGVSIGRYVADLELIAKATEPGDWAGVVQHLPL